MRRSRPVRCPSRGGRGFHRGVAVAILVLWQVFRPLPQGSDLLTRSAAQVAFLDITPVLPDMQKINRVYEMSTIPAATYRMAADVKTIVVPNVLLVRNDLDANLACVLTKAVFDRKPQLQQANAAAKRIVLDMARTTDPVPLHHGAAKALDDLGTPK